VSWLGSAERAPDTTYLVHGESSGSETLRESIDAELDWTAVVPRPMERVRLD
jgi:metallo-beta-lactamase family protein